MSTNKTYSHLENICKEKEINGLATIEDYSVVQNWKLYLDYRIVINNLMNIFIDDELEENSVCAFFAHTA